jgi:hypothetical protein
MNTCDFFRQNPSQRGRQSSRGATSSPFNPSLFWGKMWAAAVCAVAFASATACASTGPYNPDSLGSDQVAQVAEICQTVMGLKPSDPPVAGDYRGSPHLEPGISHYQACIASLSDSLQDVNDAHVVSQADADCRAKGLKSDSADLAECVLNSVETKPNLVATKVSTVASSPNSAKAMPVSVGNFYLASPHETRRREELACARLGFEPPKGAFASCVKLLDDNFYAIDNPVY